MAMSPSSAASAAPASTSLGPLPATGAGPTADNHRARLMALQFVSGSLAACGAVTITNPFDMLKTRRQLLNELKRAIICPPTVGASPLMTSRMSANMTGVRGEMSPFTSLAPPSCSPPPSAPPGRLTMRLIWQAEGLRGLQKGLLPAYIYQVLMNGTRFMVYEPLRQWFLSLTSLPNHSLLCNASAGAMAGGMAALIGSPFNLIKTRLQSFSATLPTGYQHGYGGVGEAMRQIFRGEGLAGFYRGVGASVSRTTAGSAAQLAAYDWFKPAVARATNWSSSSLPVHCVAAMGSGVLACVVMNPFDVVMTRLYNQQAAGALYSGLLDCAQKTVAAEGLSALWKGLAPHFVRVGPHTMLTFMLLEQVRSLLRPLF